MRINNNLMAINTHRQLGVSNAAGMKSMEKLSSGLRINRAADDAAGLAISEKMRGQIRGLNQASRNSADTISMIQTAEGALNETHAILQRMRELAIQSANDTNTESDRSELQFEISQLIKEVDRIGNTTEFNTKKLLDGSAAGVSDSVSATAKLNQNSATTVNIDNLNKFTAGVKADQNFFMDGAHMLVRVNEAGTIEDDFKIVGPDGTTYAFAAGNFETSIGVAALQANSILTKSSQEIATYEEDQLKIDFDLALTTALNEALGGKTISNGAAVGDYATIDEAQADAEKILYQVVDKFKEQWGNNSIINAAIDEIAKITDGKTEIGFTSVIDEGDDGSENYVANSIVIDTDDATDDLSELADNEALNKALNSLRTNVTIAQGTSIATGSTLARGSILAVGSTFVVSSSGSDAGFAFELKIQVNSADIKVWMDDNSNVWVGTEDNKSALASNTTLTLKDGTVLRNNGEGEIEVAKGFITLSSNNANTTEVGNDMSDSVNLVSTSGAGITNIAANSVLMAGSYIVSEDGNETSFATGTVFGAASNAEVIRGSISIAVNANDNYSKNYIEFAGKHQLQANWHEMTAGLSNTFDFAAYKAGSTDLDNSFMSQVGANSGQIMFVAMDDMRAKALGIDKIDVSTAYGSTSAVTLLDNATQKVSHQRASLGAMQNRLEATIRNLDTAAENLQASESRVRDVDMAKEIMENTRQNILQQASQAMLAQANQAPQSVLQLLR